MATPLFDAHGITINDPADGYHTNDEVNGFFNSRGAVPPGERGSFFQALRVHWDHIHFGGGGDNVFLKPGRDGQLGGSTLPFDYGGLSGYDGLDIPE